MWWIYENDVLTTPSGLRWQGRSGGIWTKATELRNGGRQRVEFPGDKYSDKKVPDGWYVSEPTPVGWYDITPFPGIASQLQGRWMGLPHAALDQFNFKQNRNRPFLQGKFKEPRMLDQSGNRWFCPIEPRFGTERFGMGIHPDGSDKAIDLPDVESVKEGSPDGSHGCIAILNPDTSLLLKELLTSPYKILEVRTAQRWWEKEGVDPFRKYTEGPTRKP